MATVTSQEEQDEINRQLQGAVTGIQVWLGGSDASTEGEWRWVEGPEGEEDGGAGRLFWKEGTNVQGEKGETGVNGSYLNWNGGEPNDWSSPTIDHEEDALQIRVNGLWNDLPLTSTGPTGYLRESDPNNLRVNDDVDGGDFELQKISFKRFLPSTAIDLKTLTNAKDALERVMDAQDDVIDKIALAGSNSSRLTSEITAPTRISFIRKALWPNWRRRYGNHGQSVGQGRIKFMPPPQSLPKPMPFCAKKLRRGAFVAFLFFVLISATRFLQIESCFSPMSILRNY